MKNLKNLGTILSKGEQKSIFGGVMQDVECISAADCGSGPAPNACCVANSCFWTDAIPGTYLWDYSVCSV